MVMLNRRRKAIMFAWEKGKKKNPSTKLITISLLTTILISTTTIMPTIQANDPEPTRALTPSRDLQADAGGPYHSMITIPITLNGSATGGSPPYTFQWDLDNDTEFDDASGANATWIWNITGKHTIALRVTDTELNESINSTTVTIYEHPLSADAGGPYTGSVNAIITFTGTATGGIEPYTFYWEFTNDSLYDDATGANSTYHWNTRGTYPISVKVMDSIGNQAIDNTTVTILGTSVNIEKPLPHTMYLWNIPMPIIKSSLIIGPCSVTIQIESDLPCNLTICINNEEVHTEHNLIGTHNIHTKYTSMCFGMRRISAIVTDRNGQEYTTAISVLIFCCGRLLRP
jgi:hypothetical protein